MKTTRYGIRIAVWLLMVSFAVAATPDQPKIVAYFYADGASAQHYQIADVPAEQLTHLLYAFANIENGEAVLAGNASPEQRNAGLAALRDLKQQHPHLKTLLSVGGWTWSKHFSDVALTSASRQRFTASLLRLMRVQGFDGVDIDWEFPVAGGAAGNSQRPADKANYTLLIHRLRLAVDQAARRDHRPYLLTAATSPGARWLNNTEMAKVIHDLDWINLMSYDFTGLWNSQSGHLAPLYHDPADTQPGTDQHWSVDGALDLYAAAGVPMHKIVLGLPFYGYGWQQCVADNHGQYQPCKGRAAATEADGGISFKAINERLLAPERGFTRYWNQQSKTPWLYKAETGEFFSYDDAESMACKLQLLQQRQLGGAMFWELTGDYQGQMVKQIYQTLRDHQPSTVLLARCKPSVG